MDVTIVNSTVRSQIQQAINEALPESSSIDILQERLEQNGITVRHYEFEDGTIGWSFEKDGECLAGYEIGRSYTKPAILRTLQLRICITSAPSCINFGTP